MRTTAIAMMACLMCVIRLSGQPSWEGGFFLGGSSYQGEMRESVLPMLKEIGPSAGVFSRFYLGKQWALRANIQYASFSGSDFNFSDPIRQRRGFSFESWSAEGALLLEFDLLGRRRFSGGLGYKKTFSPFVFAGVGVGYLSPAVDFGMAPGDYPSDVRADQEQNLPVFRPGIPGGAGLRLDLSDRFSLAGVLTTHYLFSDYLDGVSQAGNPATNDWLWTGGLQLTFRFKPKDTDQDGIADKEDSCPWVKGVLSAGGCPDADGDGVEDAEDVCPDVAGLFINNGCPDQDGDGIMDLIDDCPDAFGFEDTGGCPDGDNDCIPDAQDKCPDLEGIAAFGGCPDSDSDGIADHLDPCPLLAGLRSNGGCPLPDSDCDGVVDRDDGCPLLDGGEDMTGCPDSDQDGLADKYDRCPELEGALHNGGCPELNDAEKEIVSNAKTSIRFKTGSAILTASSKEVLDEIGELLHKYAYYHLRIKGYTDNQGNDETNLRLSERRSKACYDFLLYKGIGPVRMSYEGFGEANPIGDNGTSAGRRLNRRVEFEMYVPEEL